MTLARLVAFRVQCFQQAAALRVSLRPYGVGRHRRDPVVSGVADRLMIGRYGRKG